LGHYQAAYLAQGLWPADEPVPQEHGSYSGGVAQLPGIQRNPEAIQKQDNRGSLWAGSVGVPNSLDAKTGGMAQARTGEVFPVRRCAALLQGAGQPAQRS